jgi:hypothetical protein
MSVSTFAQNSLEVNEVATSGNFIINGAFDFWQRGTSVTHSASTDSTGTAYTADRFRAANVRDGVGWRNITVSRSTTVPSGFQFSARVTTGANDVNRLQFQQLGEGWGVLGGKTATFSFYIRRIGTAHASTILRTEVGGGSAETWGSFNNLSTSQFTRITRTFAAGTGLNAVGIQIVTDANTTPILATAGDLFEITGVQLEAGSVATQFRRNADSLQGELAACQRYYYTWQNSSATMGQTIGNAWYANPQTHPVEMRVAPAATVTQGVSTLYGNGSFVTGVSMYASPATANNTRVWVLGASLGSSPSLYSVWCTFDSHTVAFSAEI